jgi:hypothetical protein
MRLRLAMSSVAGVRGKKNDQLSDNHGVAVVIEWQW